VWGSRAADYTILIQGIEAARAEHLALEGAKAVDEYEVGYRERVAEGVQDD
jgi:hypothetical protein